MTAKVLPFNNNLLAVTSDGYAYLLNPSSGMITKKIFVGQGMLQPVVSGNSAYLASSTGKLAKLDNQGGLEWSIDLTSYNYNITYVYGIDVQESWIYLTVKNAVYKIKTNGKDAVKLCNAPGTLTAPEAGSGYVIFGNDNSLVRIDNEGKNIWTTDISGEFWTSTPVVSGSYVYVGALDNKLHAFYLNGGYESYYVDTKNWVMSTPTVSSDGIVYFGSNNGKLYAVDSLGGTVKWTANIGRAVQTKPEIGSLGGKEVVFVGSNDNNIYAVETINGEIVWKGSTAGWVESPLYYQNKVIFGSRDARVYSYSTERACSITSPHEAEIVGVKEIVVTGSAVSDSSNMKVYVAANNGNWEEATLSSKGDWTFYIDPSKNLNFGLNAIYCKVSDAAGEESGTYTSVSVTRSAGASASNFLLSVDPSNPKIGEQFTVYVNDGDDGSAVERVKIKIGDNEISVNKSASFVMNSSGKYQITVSKIGFNDGIITVEVISTEVPFYYYVIGTIVLVVLLYLLYKKFVKK